MLGLLETMLVEEMLAVKDDLIVFIRSGPGKGRVD